MSSQFIKNSILKMCAGLLTIFSFFSVMSINSFATPVSVKKEKKAQTKVDKEAAAAKTVKHLSFKNKTKGDASFENGEVAPGKFENITEMDLTINALDVADIHIAAETNALKSIVFEYLISETEHFVLGHKTDLKRLREITGTKKNYKDLKGLYAISGANIVNDDKLEMDWIGYSEEFNDFTASTQKYSIMVGKKAGANEGLLVIRADTRFQFGPVSSWKIIPALHLVLVDPRESATTLKHGLIVDYIWDINTPMAAVPSAIKFNLGGKVNYNFENLEFLANVAVDWKMGEDVIFSILGNAYSAAAPQDVGINFHIKLNKEFSLDIGAKAPAASLKSADTVKITPNIEFSLTV